MFLLIQILFCEFALFSCLQIVVSENHTGCFAFDEHIKETDHYQILRVKQRNINVSYEDIALLPFSSGTTGVPKGVMLSLVAQLTALRYIVSILFSFDFIF